MNWRVEHAHPLVTTIHLEFAAVGEERWFLLRSDAHHDNTHCDQYLERRHLQEAISRQAGIIDIGDLHCAMQGRFDPRADQEQLRPELRGNDYLDRLTEYAVAFYQPFAANWLHLSPGNHETNILKRNGIDLSARLAKGLQAVGSPVVVGPYRGWIWFKFTCAQTQRMSRTMHYHHGAGGGGPVTKDIISFNRQMVYLDADFIISGHTHDQLSVPVRRERLSHQGKPVIQDVECIKLGSYKDEFSPGAGWAVERGHSPKALGAYWLVFRCLGRSRSQGAAGYTIQHDVIRAH